MLNDLRLRWILSPRQRCDLLSVREAASKQTTTRILVRKFTPGNVSDTRRTPKPIFSKINADGQLIINLFRHFHYQGTHSRQPMRYYLYDFYRYYFWKFHCAKNRIPVTMVAPV